MQALGISLPSMELPTIGSGLLFFSAPSLLHTKAPCISSCTDARVFVFRNASSIFLVEMAANFSE